MRQVEGGQVECMAVAYPGGQVLRDLDQHLLPVGLFIHFICLGPEGKAWGQSMGATMEGMKG